MPWGPDEDKQLQKPSTSVGYTTLGKALLGPYWCRTWVAENTPDYAFSWPADSLMVDLTGLSLANYRRLIHHSEDPPGQYRFDCRPWNGPADWPEGPVVQVDPWAWPGMERGWTYVRYYIDDYPVWYLEVQVSTYCRNEGTVGPDHGCCYALYVYGTNTGDREGGDYYYGDHGFFWAGLKGGDTPYGVYKVACTTWMKPINIQPGPTYPQTPQWVTGAVTPYNPPGQQLPCGQNVCNNLEFTVSAV